MSAVSVTWICSRSSTLGTGMTMANSAGSPWKSLAMVITVRPSLRAITTFEAWLNRSVSALAT